LSEETLCPFVITMIQEDTMALPDDDLFPPDYTRSPRLTPYENLEGAKLYWLIRKLDTHQSVLNVDRRQLPELNGEQRAIIEEQIRAHEAAITEVGREIRVLEGKNIQAKRALVKRNVEVWIRHLRSRAQDFRRYADIERQQASDATNK